MRNPYKIGDRADFIAYSDATLAMTSETLPADFYGARSITRSHDNLGRSTGFALSPLPLGEGQGEGTAPYSVSYDYDLGARCRARITNK